MTTKRTIGILLSSAAFLFSPGVAAQQNDEDEGFLLGEAPVEEPEVVYSSEIEAGIGWSSEDSFKFGEFSGLTDRGPFIIGNFAVRMRDAYDSGDSEYWILSGTNLGLTSRALSLEYGRQGSFSLFAAFDQRPKYLLDDARTPYFLLDGGTLLTLPAGWVPGDRDTSEMTLLDQSLNDVNIEHKRTKYGGGFSWIPRKNWLVESAFYRELKEGNRTIAAIFGSSGGNPAAVIVPEPVDYDTDNFDISIGYTGKRANWALAYNLSVFRDNFDSLTFQNAYTATQWSPSASFPTGFGRMALPPDNKAHRVTLSGGYKLSDRTRATANLVYGRMTQDDAFLPYTVNSGLSVTTPLPRASLDGEIETTLANLAVNSRLTNKLNINVRYRYDNRDNNTPRDIYVLLRNDSEDQGTVDSRGRINLPYSRKQHLFDLDAGYRLSDGLKMSLGYSYEQLERNFSEVAKTTEHKFEAKLRTTGSANLSGWAGVEYGSRDGSSYIDNALFLASHPNAAPDEFENHPLVRKYFIADRDQLKFSGALNWVPSDKASVSVMGRYSQDDYDNSELGLTESTTTSLTVDTAYNPSDELAWHAFYTYESFGYDQSGYSHRPFPPLNVLDNFAGQGWSVDTDDTVNSFGVGVEWAAIKNELDISFDYTYSMAKTDYGLAGGTLITFEPIPNLKSTFHSANLLADYKYSDNMWLRFRYMLQDFEVQDFALDGIDPDTMAFTLGLGNQSPNYTVHVIGISTIYRF